MFDYLKKLDDDKKKIAIEMIEESIIETNDGIRAYHLIIDLRSLCHEEKMIEVLISSGYTLGIYEFLIFGNYESYKSRLLSALLASNDSELILKYYEHIRWTDEENSVNVNDVANSILRNNNYSGAVRLIQCLKKTEENKIVFTKLYPLIMSNPIDTLRETDIAITAHVYDGEKYEKMKKIVLDSKNIYLYLVFLCCKENYDEEMVKYILANGDSNQISSLIEKVGKFTDFKKFDDIIIGRNDHDILFNYYMMFVGDEVKLGNKLLDMDNYMSRDFVLSNRKKIKDRELEKLREEKNNIVSESDELSPEESNKKDSFVKKMLLNIQKNRK